MKKYREPKDPITCFCGACGKECAPVATGKGYRKPSKCKDGLYRCYYCIDKYKKDYIDADNRRDHINQRYGISLKTFEDISNAQNNVCKICKKKNTRDRFLQVDHDHKTGKIRSLLCSHCNNGLGCFFDNIEVMKLAIQYLQDHREG